VIAAVVVQLDEMKFVGLGCRVAALVTKIAVAEIDVDLDPGAGTGLVWVGDHHNLNDATAGGLTSRAVDQLVARRE
jgi:hypothetical protein